MNIQTTLAFRYLSGRKLRTFLTTLAVVFGVLVLFGMNIILPSMMESLQANAMAAEGQVDVTITQRSGEPFDAGVFDQLSSVDGIRAASVSLNRTVNLPANFYDQNPARPDRVNILALEGVDPVAVRSIRSFPLLSGRFLQAGDTASAVISQSLADELSVKVGDSFPIPTTIGVVHLSVVGILPPRTVPGNEEVFVTLKEAQEIANQPGKINAIDVNLNTNDETRRYEIIAAMEAVLGKDYTVDSLISGSEMYATLQMAQVLISLFGILALFMGAFIIFNTFRTLIVERRRDIGMLRALGAERKTIIGLILSEGLLQGFIGTVIGLALGYLMAAGVLRLAGPVMTQYINLKIGGPVVTLANLGISILLGTGVTIFAGLIPALNASRVTPLDALRPSLAELEFKRQTGRGFFAGAALIVASLLALFSQQVVLVGPAGILFLVGLVLVAPGLVRPFANLFGWIISRIYTRAGVGELAKGNLSRQPSRVAITASASMLGLAVIVALSGLVSSLTLTLSDVLKKNLGSDYLFIPPTVALWSNDLGSSADFASRLRAIDGVDQVSTLRFASTTVDGNMVSLMGIDPQAFQKVSGLRFLENSYPSESGAYQALSSGRTMIANGVFMTALGVKIGDQVELATSKGKQSYRIVAVATDLLNAKVTAVFISQAAMLADFDKSEDVFIQLNLKPGANVSAADQAIRAAAANYPQFNIVDGRAYYNLTMAQMDVAFVGLYLMLAILALPSLIAMLNTLAIGVIERTREIGMIRAVGSSQAQIRNMVLAEALILAAIGTSFGLLAGLYLGRVFVIALAPIFPLGYAFPASGILVAIAVGLLFGALAAVIPARQAARLEIVQALHYE